MCGTCGLDFATRKTLQRHQREICDVKAARPVFVCPICQALFTRKFSVRQHIVEKHPEADQGKAMEEVERLHSKGGY